MLQVLFEKLFTSGVTLWLSYLSLREALVYSCSGTAAAGTAGGLAGAGRGPRAACCGRGPRGALQPRRREPPTALPRCQSNPKYHKVQQKRPTYVPRPRSKINRGARHLTSYRRHAVQRPACAERSTDTMRSSSISHISPSGTPRSCNGLK